MTSSKALNQKLLSSSQEITKTTHYCFQNLGPQLQASKNTSCDFCHL